VIDQGKLFYVNLPAADRERMSRVVNTLIKLEFQKHVLKRPNKRRPSFMLIDEFQILGRITPPLRHWAGCFVPPDHRPGT
jgi:type IV secretory pathway TraG/TraD family ATPase VirD4